MKEIMDFITGDYDECTCLNKLPLAYSYTPIQELDSLYDYADALKNGTVFPELKLPKGVYGNNFGSREDSKNG